MKPPQSVSISTATFMKAVLIVLGLWFFWFIRDIVAIFVASILLSALIDPFASWLAARKIPRGIAVIIVYTLLLAVTSVFIVALVPIIAEQGTQLFANASVYYQEAAESLGQFRQFSGDGGFAEGVVTSLESLQTEITGSFGSLFSTVKGVVGGIAASFIILVLAFYMVVEEERMSHYFKKLAPVEYRPYVSQLLKKMQNKMGQWLRAQLILGLVVGVAVYIGLKILGVEYALLLAIIAGVLEIVPYLGPIIAVVPALMIGLAQAPIIGLSVLGLYLLIQQVENNILVPKIMQKVTGLNPVISILALLVGLKAGGVAGAILAIPLAMMSVVILEDLFRDVTE
ncbi:MAG: AI-2E family transporter [bacterium]|jgi:predicted PurR-regulated permease PerM|nr:AI-2E family transporter [bacterium]